MRHRRLTKHFSRKSGPRKALLRNLVVSLVEHERIKTTLTKAKELRRHVERAITRGKGGTLQDFRLLLSKYPSEPTVNKIMKEISPRFVDRPGGYTRIIKLGTRPGDRAEMAFIEFVDFDYEAAVEKRKQPKTVKLRDSKNKLIEKQMTLEELAKHQEKVQLRKAAAKRTGARKRASAARKVLRASL